MNFHQIVIDIIVVFVILGALDACFGGRFGLGRQFREGVGMMGSLALSMIGMISLAPVLGKLLKPAATLICGMVGADPAMLTGCFFSIGMGGYPLAVEMAQTPEAGMFSGVILSSMLGAALVFSTPVALGMIRKEDEDALAFGTLAGIMAVPAGCVAGGAVAGYGVVMMLRNLAPVILVAVLIAGGLILIPAYMVKGFIIFGRMIVMVSMAGFVLAIVEELTGFGLIPGMAAVEEGIQTVGSIAIVLTGAYPMVTVITRIFRRPVRKLGKLLGINETAAAGLVTTLANNIPMFGMMKDMDERGKRVNAAFSVCAAFVFGDHLGFIAGTARTMITPMIAGKLAGGAAAVLIAVWMSGGTGRQCMEMKKVVDKRSEM